MSLLPPNATPIERALEAAMARLGDVPVPLRDLWSPDDCPVAILPFLAWALSIDGWSSDWPEQVKRARVRNALAIQKQKGTAASVRSVVASFGGAVALREWWQLEPPGEPHTFSLVMTLDESDGQQASAEFVDAVIAEVWRVKPVRSRFTFTQGLTARGAIGAVGAARPAAYARLQFTA